MAPLSLSNQRPFPARGTGHPQALSCTWHHFLWRCPFLSLYYLLASCHCHLSPVIYVPPLFLLAYTSSYCFYSLLSVLNCNGRVIFIIIYVDAYALITRREWIYEYFPYGIVSSSILIQCERIWFPTIKTRRPFAQSTQTKRKSTSGNGFFDSWWKVKMVVFRGSRPFRSYRRRLSRN